MLVPLIVLYRMGMGQLENTFLPGPAIFTSPPLGLMPPLEKKEIPRSSSSEATAMIDGLFAGRETGLM